MTRKVNMTEEEKQAILKSFEHGLIHGQYHVLHKYMGTIMLYPPLEDEKRNRLYAKKYEELSSEILKDFDAVNIHYKPDEDEILMFKDRTPIIKQFLEESTVNGVLDYDVFTIKVITWVKNGAYVL
jgi:hypothetical protein